MNYPTSIEIHANTAPEFTSRGYGRKVKSAGGSYSSVRGDKLNRYVHVPLTHPDLIDEIISEFGGHRKTTVVFRGGDTHKIPAWVIVQYIPAGFQGSPIEKAVDGFNREYKNALSRGLIPSPKWCSPGNPRLPQAS